MSEQEQQHEIQKHEIDPAMTDLSKCVALVGGLGDGLPGVGEIHVQQPADGALVINDQNVTAAPHRWQRRAFA